MTVPVPADPGAIVIPALDPANPLLAPGPSLLTTAKVMTPDGARLLICLRTDSATVSTFADKATVLAWADQLRGEADGMSGTRLITGNGAG